MRRSRRGCSREQVRRASAGEPKSKGWGWEHRAICPKAALREAKIRSGLRAAPPSDFGPTLPSPMTGPLRRAPPELALSAKPSGAVEASIM